MAQRTVAKRRRRLIRSGTLGVAAFLACAAVIFVVWRASSTGWKRESHLPPLEDDSPPVALDKATESRIVAFCGDCHAMPRPESFPRDAWHDKVRKGYDFYVESGRNDLDPPPVYLAAAYYRFRAPEQLVFPEPEEAETELRVAFTVERLPLDLDLHVPPAISHLRWAQIEVDEAPVLLACDMRHGGVTAVDLRDRQRRPEVLARLDNPCHVEPCDLDGDQAIDLIVADLGSFFPDDHDRGRVVWLRREESGRSFEAVVVASGLGRVCDARPADFDADGDLDLIVAEFGWHKTGSIVLLKNVAGPGRRPRFKPEELDPRPGAIHVPVDDFNHDGRLDFMALVSQEYESVDAFLGQGDGRFVVQNLWTGPDLTFGSSGIELLDVDQDGDTDVLYTNGDAFDNNYASPTHGVQWLENLGGLQFAYHRLTDMPGVHRALAGDVDLDGDLDVVASAFLPHQLLPPSLAARPLASILCLEQTSPGVFVRHTLETGFPHYAALETADFDDDGDLDFAVGPHMVRALEMPHWLAVWWNQAIVAPR